VGIWHWTVIALAITLALYGALLAGLVRAGRRGDARAAARFVPDCLVLFKRLLADPRVPFSRKAVLAASIAYLAIPIDLVPDFIPVAGHADDALVVALALRSVLRAAEASVLHEHWPGPERSFQLIRRFALASGG
jgi:uncharacterized membrane protein YkvA (DUF1232 family)